MSDDIDDDGPDPSAQAPIPYDRFAKVAGQKRELKAQVKSMEEELATLRAHSGQAEGLAQQLADMKAQHERAAGEWSQEKALIGRGLVDAEAQTVARALYGSLPDETRPNSIADWLGGFDAEGAEVPRALAAYLPGKEPARVNGAQPKPLPSRTTAAAQGGDVDAAAIRRAREDALKTGDWAAFNRIAGVRL